MNRNLTLGLIALLLICSCGKKSATHTLREGKGGKKLGGTFYTNETGDLRSVDPPQNNDETSAHISESIYNGLLEFDQNLKVLPSLSALPEVSSDGLTYTFHLRSDVYFHDDPCFPNSKGRKFVAQDVVYCWSRALDPSTNTLAYPYFQVIQGADVYFKSGAKTPGGVSGLKAPNDSTFVVTLLKPFSPFYDYPLLGAAYIYPHEAIEKYGKEYAHHGVGTGPFQWVTWKEGQYCLVKRNPHYWEHDADGNQLPYLDSIKYSFMKETKAELLSLEQNSLDHVYRIPNEFYKDVVDENKKAKGKYTKYQVMHIAALSSQFYGFNTRDVSNVHLRRAFSFAIDRNKIVKYVLSGQAAAPGEHGIVPPSMPGYLFSTVTGFSFNLDSAKAELELAKKDLNGNLPNLTLQYNTGGGRNDDVAQAIQSQIQSNLGVKIGLQQVEWAQHTAMIDEGKAKFFRLGWVADYPDPQNFLNLLYGKNIPATGPSSINSTRYSNPEFDKLYEAAIASTNRDEINKLWAQAESLAMHDAPMIVIYYDEDFHLLQPDVKDFPLNAMNRLVFTRTWFND